MPHVAIESATFHGLYVSLDGRGVTHKTDNGGGTVNAQPRIGAWETYEYVDNHDGTVSFQATTFPNVFLRLDGSGVNKGQDLAQGGGVVNAQYTAGSYEKFRIIKEDSHQDIIGIESVAFPGRYLRLDGNSKKVNVQGVFKTYEQFRIVHLS